MGPATRSLPRWRAALCAAALLAAAAAARAQQDPHIGYVYPAGGRQGATFEVAVGGQYIRGVSEAYISGEGAEVTVGKHIMPVSRGQLNKLRMKLQELRRQQSTDGKRPARGRGALQPGDAAKFEAFAKTLGLKEMTLKAYTDLRRKLLDPKRQPNPQIAETVLIKLTLSADAACGPRELRLKTGQGLTNPIIFHVGPYAEVREAEPNDDTPAAATPASLPAVINGQIMPGDVDRFRFKAAKGTKLVAAVAARQLVPYLADAVPGWFQATLKLSDSAGKELAFTDDFRFHPDPVIYYEVPADGEYVLEIADAIFRGRQDFVYRITLGEVPFVTGVFPLGGRAGGKAVAAVAGWNLPVSTLTVDAKELGPGVVPVSVGRGGLVSNQMPFALGALPETTEAEPNNERGRSQRVALPRIVNGRIDSPGDWDVFSFHGRAGQQIVAEVHARRLESPLDSLLKLTDAAGRQLALSDDHADSGAGLTTHQADSRLDARLPADGTYYLHIGDTQHKGGAAHAYRLRISWGQADFALRVVPSTVNARPGQTLPVTVYALRKDGFAGEIALKLKDMPPGFVLSGGRVPAGADKIRATLTAPRKPRKQPVNLALEGRARIGGKDVRRPAVPAEDMMQAFLYRHLVPTAEGMVSVIGGPRRGAVPPLKVLGTGPVKLPVGGTARVRVSAPRGPFMQRIKLALSEPAEGIAIQKVSRSPGVVTILLSVGKAKPGLEGNLIVGVFSEWTRPARDGKPAGRTRRVPLGVLPAIPFKIVPAARTTAARP